jgi:hypothetical protein
VKLTPHQFRHLAAKIVLHANPGAYELVRQMLGHKNMKKCSDAIIRKKSGPRGECAGLFASGEITAIRDCLGQAAFFRRSS